MDGDSMKLNRSRNVFISPRSSSECLPRRHSSVVHKNSGPEEFAGGQQQFLKEAKRRSWSTTGINEIASHSFDTMSGDQLRELILMLTGNIEKLQNELRNASAENLNLRHQLQCRTKKNPSPFEHLPNNSSFRRSNNASQRCSSVVPFECDESLVEHEENSMVADDEIMFLVPEDLKNEEPSRISVFLSQSMTVLAHINNQEVIEKVCAGSQVAKQVTIGGVAGYFTSHLIRKFGKIAVGSIVGSLCFIKFAHHRGYIAVDWNKIQKQIENPNTSGAGDGSSSANNTVENDIAWLTDKYQKIRKWSKENSYTVLGFWGGFCAHNLYT